MVELDSATVAILVTVLIALLGLAAAWGTIREKVKRNHDDIVKNKEYIERDMKSLMRDNQKDHERIYDKIEEVNNYLRNGKGS